MLSPGKGHANLPRAVAWQSLQLRAPREDCSPEEEIPTLGGVVLTPGLQDL